MRHYQDLQQCNDILCALHVFAILATDAAQGISQRQLQLLEQLNQRLRHCNQMMWPDESSSLLHNSSSSWLHLQLLLVKVAAFAMPQPQQLARSRLSGCASMCCSFQAHLADADSVALIEPVI